MALIDEIDKINSILTLSERARNLVGRGVISNTIAKVMQEKITEYLETLFPPPPPPE